MAIFLGLRCPDTGPVNFTETGENYIYAGQINLSSLSRCRDTQLILNSATQSLTYRIEASGPCSDGMGGEDGSYSEIIELTTTGTLTVVKSWPERRSRCAGIRGIFPDDLIDLENRFGNLNFKVTPCNGDYFEYNQRFDFITLLELAIGNIDANGVADIYYYAEATNLTTDSSQELVIDGFNSNGSIDVSINELNFSIPFYNHFRPPLISYMWQHSVDGIYNFHADFSFTIQNC